MSNSHRTSETYIERQLAPQVLLAIEHIVAGVRIVLEHFLTVDVANVRIVVVVFDGRRRSRCVLVVGHKAGVLDLLDHLRFVVVALVRVLGLQLDGGRVVFVVLRELQTNTY